MKRGMPKLPKERRKFCCQVLACSFSIVSTVHFHEERNALGKVWESIQIEFACNFCLVLLLSAPKWCLWLFSCQKVIWYWLGSLSAYWNYFDDLSWLEVCLLGWLDGFRVLYAWTVRTSSQWQSLWLLPVLLPCAAKGQCEQRSLDFGLQNPQTHRDSSFISWSESFQSENILFCSLCFSSCAEWFALGRAIPWGRRAVCFLSLCIWRACLSQTL